MGMSEEEQMQAMLAEMGETSIDALDSASSKEVINPIPEGPVSIKKNEEKIEVLPPQVDNLLPDINEEEINTSANEEGTQLASSQPVSSQPVFSQRSVNSSSRELTVNSLVHLMGLPTSVQVDLLNTKLDLVTVKMSNINSKLEKVQEKLNTLTNDSPMERMEFQITEIRSIMKKFFPVAFQSGTNTQGLEQKIATKPQVLSSQTKLETKTKPTETSIHVDVKEAEEEPLSDEDYQVLESMKMREAHAEKQK